MYKWLSEEYGPQFTSLPLFVQRFAGSSSVEEGMPTENVNIVFNDVYHYAQVCGESRLWGGMHFTASVSASQEICNNLGIDAYNYVKDILQGSNLTSVFYG